MIYNSYDKKTVSAVGKKRVNTVIGLFIFLLGSGFFMPLQAQTSNPAVNSYMNFIILIFLFLLVLTFTGFIYLNDKNEQAAPRKQNAFIKAVFSKLSGAAPIEKEADIMLSHDFDGIKELDNDLPPWWKYLFYVTVVFACIYFANFHLWSSHKLMADEYNDEVKAAELQKAELIKTGAFISESSVTLLKNVEELSKGKEIFTANCATCHGSKGEGLVGPNLTDDYWIHGGGIKNVFTTIKYGVPSKGMLTWQTQLSPKQIQQVASFVISLRGTNPPNAKPQEGTLYKEEADSSAVELKKL